MTVKTLSKPPTLTTLCSISCGMAAQEFFRLTADAGVTAIVDIRVNRTYSRAFWTSERDIGYLCQLHHMEYVVIDDLMPTVELRQELHGVIDDKKRSRMDCAEAWTRYLEEYSVLINQRQYLNNNRPVRELIYSSHKAIAVICGCHHHRDCHRSAALGQIAKWVDGLEIKELYPDGHPPSRETNKILLRDIPGAQLVQDEPARIARALKVRA